MKIIAERCLRCYGCSCVCPSSAIVVVDLLPIIDDQNCNRCGQCRKVCPVGAIDENRADPGV
ncbi:ferredoxin [candidate division WOR-3 bacterium]|uniref:Ferredoxin n=1 Tax=candidate division WOR-3 bacterium TaxID=2052148 RepID=A0A660SHZ0_UNCW3|nr:MAG: ferredoxin [candidate division WOR-3 bacterium]